MPQGKDVPEPTKKDADVGEKAAREQKDRVAADGLSGELSEEAQDAVDRATFMWTGEEGDKAQT